uniref:Fibrinogen C-terminal domain-containing protein n=1 Tax=Macrostomum lignano TaxID=282301 RepID=A0A1I8HXV9_9PLAT
PDAGIKPSWSTSFVQLGSRRFVIIQQRSNGRLSFERNWTEYENGFGDAEEFWVAEYSHFSVAGSDTNYVMTYKAYLSGHSNTTGDSLSTHKGMQFSTMDRDNDKKSGSCSKTRGNAGWWLN